MSISIRQAVIPCAGFGTRLLPATKCVPKELLPILNKPAIQYVVEELLESGITHIIFVENPAKPSVAQHFVRNEHLEFFLKTTGKHDYLQDIHRIEESTKFDIVIQEKPLGLGDAILCAKKHIHDEMFVVALPDVIFSRSARSTQKLLDVCREQNLSGLTLFHIPTKLSKLYGMVWGHSKNGLLMIDGAIEKPEQKDSPSDLAIVGRYVLPRAVFETLTAVNRDKTGETELTKALHQLAQYVPTIGIVEDQPIFDVGTVNGIIEATAYFSQFLVED